METDQSSNLLKSSAETIGTSGSDVVLVFISMAATVITIYLYFTPYSAIKHIQQKKSVGAVAGVQFISSMLNCFLWVSYSLLISNKTMFFVNSIGFLLSSYYVFIYWKYSLISNSYLMKIILAIILAITILSISFVSDNIEDQSFKLGFLASIICVLMFASPLEKMISVLRLKNSEGMLPTLAIASLACGISWTIFGLLVGDIFIYLPNILATILSTIQYYLILKYPPTSINFSNHSSIYN